MKFTLIFVITILIVVATSAQGASRSNKNRGPVQDPFAKGKSKSNKKGEVMQDPSAKGTGKFKKRGKPVEYTQIMGDSGIGKKKHRKSSQGKMSSKDLEKSLLNNLKENRNLKKILKSGWKKNKKNFENVLRKSMTRNLKSNLIIQQLLMKLRKKPKVPQVHPRINMYGMDPNQNSHPNPTNVQANSLKELITRTLAIGSGKL